MENDTSQVLIIHLAQEKSLLMSLNMVLKTTTGRPSWILNVKMVSEYNENLSVRSGMPNLVEKVTLFAFKAHLFQEISLLMVFNMASTAFWAAILNSKVKTDSKYSEYHYIRSAKQELVENDTS